MTINIEKEPDRFVVYRTSPKDGMPLSIREIPFGVRGAERIKKLYEKQQERLKLHLRTAPAEA